MRPRHRARDATEAQQRERAAARARLLAAVEIGVDLAREAATQHVGIGEQHTEPRLPDGRAAALHADVVRVGEERQIDVGDMRAVVEPVHEHEPRELDGAFGRRLRGGRQGDGE